MDKWEYHNKPCYLENCVVREPCKRRSACIYVFTHLMVHILHSKFLVLLGHSSWIHHNITNICAWWVFFPYSVLDGFLTSWAHKAARKMAPSSRYQFIFHLVFRSWFLTQKGRREHSWGFFMKHFLQAI